MVELFFSPTSLLELSKERMDSDVYTVDVES